MKRLSGTSVWMRSIRASFLFLASVLTVGGHNLDTRATSIAFAKDFVKVIAERAKNEPGQPFIRVGDEFWVVIKTTAGPGTKTGVGGYQTFYVPDGVRVKDVAYVFPDKRDKRGFVKIPLKGQSPIAIGDGSQGSESTSELIGWSLPGVNGLGFKADPVSASGRDRGTIAGVYADTGVFFSTDPRTVFNSYGAALVGGASPMRNDSGDTVGEYYSASTADSNLSEVFGVMTTWDAHQLQAYGRGDVQPIVDDGDGRGNTPWGLGNAVAGPQSGYAWGFNAATYLSTGGTKADRIKASIGIGPWQRVRYPGSQISQDQPGLKSSSLGNVGVDASLLGAPVESIPANANAIRFAIGQLELGRPELSAVKIEITAENAVDCWTMYADAFGGDAGGVDNGKDHIWRYFDPSAVKLNPCLALQKVADKKIAKIGDKVKYDITFLNNGNTTIPNVRIVDTLPTGLQHMGGKPTANLVDGQKVTWIIGDVAPYSMVSIEHAVKVTGSGSLLNTATVTSNNNPIVQVNEVIEVRNQAILIKSKTVDKDTAARGDTVEYTLLVENKGTAENETPLVIRENLPPGFTFVNFVSATVNKSRIFAPTVKVNAEDPSKPVFTISQGIKESKFLELVFTAKIGNDVPVGTYYNSFEIKTPKLIYPPIPEAPVQVGGASIGDEVFNDWNGNGTQDAGDEGIAGVLVELYASDGITFLRSRTTDAQGGYIFGGLNAGTYVVKVAGGIASGLVLSADGDSTLDGSHTVTLTDPEEIYLLADFGYRPAGSASIGDTVFEDIGNDGIYNSAVDQPIPGATISLYEDTNGDGIIDPAADQLITTTVTSAGGLYLFSNLAPSYDYIVTVAATDPAVVLYFASFPYAPSTGLSQSVTNLTGSYLETDFGFWAVVPAAIGDQLFIDANGSGVFDASETPLANITVWLDTNNNGVIDGGERTTVSGPDGIYTFENLGVDTFTVRVDVNDADIPSGHTPSRTSYTVALTSGQTFLEADFPFVPVFSKLVDKEFAAAGDILTYTMHPFWPGPDLLVDAKVTDTVPLGTSLVSVSQGGGTGGLVSNPAINGSHPGAVGSGTVNAAAAADSWLNTDSSNTNYGSSTTMILDSAGGDEGDNRLVMRFDLSGVPAGANITGATLRLRVVSVSGNESRDVVVYPLTQSFSESQTTWNIRSTGNNWSSQGGDFGTTIASTTVAGVGSYTWSSAALTSRVQSWFANPATNFGILLGDENSGGVTKSFATKENATTSLRPVLEITFSGGPSAPATMTSITAAPSTVTDSGGGTNVTVSMTVTATGAVTGISPGALSVVPGANGASATLVSGPTGSPSSIGSGGGSTTFSWVYSVNAGTSPDQVAFSGNAAGSGATFASATSNGVVVSEPTTGELVTWNLGSNTPAVSGSDPGLAPITNVASLTSVADSEIWSDKPTDNYGTENVMWIERTNNYLNRLPIRFDVSTIPANAMITSAVMTLNRKSGKSGNPAIAAHRLTQDWSETAVTWNNRSAATPWTTAGGDGDYDPIAAATTNVASNGNHNWAVTSLVQNWVNGTNPNYGVLMRLPNQTLDAEHEFRTREDGTAANRPNLTVNYTIPATPTTTTSISVLPALVTDSGSGTNVNVSMTVTSTGTVSNISPTALSVIPGTNGAGTTFVSGPTGSPASIGAGGGSATFTWVYNVTAGTIPDQVRFTGAATGVGAIFAAATSNGVIVTQPLTMTVQIDSPDPGVSLVTNTAQYFNGPNFLAEDTAVTALTGSIGDFVWADLDGDGVQDSGEFGIGGVTVRLYAADGVTLIETTSTDSQGQYRFYSLTAGNYFVVPDPSTAPSGYAGTTASSVSVSLAEFQQFNDADFGFDSLPSGTGSIGDYVWLDLNRDGVQDSGELGIADVQVILERSINGNWSQVGTTTTDADGLYQFNVLTDGDYRVTVNSLSLITSPYSSSTHALGDATVPTFDKDGIATPNSALVSLSSGSRDFENLDFGYDWNGTIGDYVWHDDNRNGIQDEPAANGIPDAEVLLYHDVDGDGLLSAINGDLQIGRLTTDAAGNYLFVNLPPGEYLVDVYEDSFNDAAVPTGASVVARNLGGTEIFLDADFGYYVGARVNVTVFWDKNSNSFNDSGNEPLLGGVSLTLAGTDELGNAVNETLPSTGGGSVAFIVPPGDYSVSYDTTTSDSLYPELGTRTTTTTYEFTLAGGDENAQSYEFGLDNSGAIGDTVFADLDGDGSQSLAEPGLEGVTVNLYLDSDGNGIIDLDGGDLLLDVSTTDGTGFYEFGGLADTTGDQNYRVKVLTGSLPSSYQSVPTSFPSGADAATSEYSTVLASAAVIDSVDFGYPLVPATYLTVSGTVYDDDGSGGATASNGTQDGTESGIVSVSVTLTVDVDNDSIIDFTYIVPTDPSGNYSFGGIPEGSDIEITVDETTLPSAAYVQTGDPDGGVLSNAWVVTNLILNVADLDFGYIEVLGSIAGTVVIGDGNGLADLGEVAVGGVTVNLREAGEDGFFGSDDDVLRTAVTNSTGDYSFIDLPPGDYETYTVVPGTLVALADRDGGNPNSINLTLASGDMAVDQDFEYQESLVSGTLWVDGNQNNAIDGGETLLQGVAVFADLDRNGTQSPDEPDATTDSNGFYSFDPIGSGFYDIRVKSATLPANLLPSFDYDGVGSVDVASITVPANGDITDVDFAYIVEPGSISGSVTADSPLVGVTLVLKNSAGEDVDSDLITPGVQPTVTVTDASGNYSFTNVPPGSYQVLENQPVGYVSVSDTDGGNLDIIGDVTLVQVLSGVDSGGNDFVEALGDCPSNWAEWKVQNPGEIASGNPDGDTNDNLTEFSFAMETYSGAGDAYRIQPSAVTPGEIDLIFTRPNDAVSNVVYTLEYASTVGNPTVWASFEIIPSMYTFVDNGDCTETITITDLETVTGINGGEGVVRIKVELDEENDMVVDHTSYTGTEGWKETSFGICCQTYNTPYLLDTIFTGVVDAGGISGQVVDLSGSSGTTDLATLLTPGASYYLEITNGTGEGNRFDIASATGSTLTLANDSVIDSAAAPYNTIVGPPVGFEGSEIVIRRHRTLAELFDPSDFVASTDQALADEIQIYSGGVWTIIHLYDDSGTSRWVDNFNNQNDQGGLIIAQGQGLFFNNRNSPATLLAYGEVRENDFIRPLGVGSNLVGGGYPTDQSATGTGSRTMSLTEGLFGSKDFKTADSFFVWKGDMTPGLSTYDTYYLLNGAPQSPSLLRWVKQGDATATSRDGETLLLENRAVFVRSAAGLIPYGYPSPWTP